MIELTLDNLKRCFEAAKENNANFVGVKIEMGSFDAPEVIINNKANFDKKLNYYMSAYNEDLFLKSVNTIRIVGFTYGMTYAEIQEDLIGL